MEIRRQDIHNSDIPLVCRACEARHGGVCGALTSEQLSELNRHSSRHRLETGAEVIGQGETVVNYSNIMRGVVKLTKVMADGRQQIVGLQFAPDFLGRPFLEESAITAEAATDSEVCNFPRHLTDRLDKRTTELEHKQPVQALNELDAA